MSTNTVRRIREAENIRNVRNLRAIRRYRDHIDPFEIYSEREFKRRYRLNKNNARFVIELLKDDLKMTYYRKNSIKPELQILTALRFYAKGLYQEDNGDLHCLSQPAVSRIIKKVSIALASKLKDFVHFPKDLNKTKKDFFSIAGFPNVVGCIDCTYIKIKNPDKQQPLLYCNRKGWYSLNVQVVSDARCRILDLVARWRGSVHDARIWNDCTLAEKFERAEINGLLLGDGEFPCTHYLLTPLLNPQTAPEQRYNQAHISTRSRVEHLFGQWKNIFRALQSGLLISLDTAKAAIATMAVLHHIRKDMNDDSESSDDDSEDEISIVDPQFEEPLPQQQNRGSIFRQNFIRKYFT